MKHFWLIRHAKSDWGNAGQADIDRDLNGRGRKDGALMQNLFASNRFAAEQRPDWLVISAARRAQATAKFVAKGFGVRNEQMVIEQSLYNAAPEDLLAALRETPPDAQCVALIAHNPGMTWLVNTLAGSGANAEQPGSDRLPASLPTFGSALFASSVSQWADLQQADLLELITPRMIRS